MSNSDINEVRILDAYQYDRRIVHLIKNNFKMPPKAKKIDPEL
jgi:hypothetical protein